MSDRRVWLMNGKRFDREARSIAILPVGSVERHGDHLPLGTDAIEAEAVSLMVAERLDAHVFPPVWYGTSPGLRRFGGTVDVDPLALYGYVKSVIKEILRNGYLIVLVLNGHGGNSHVLRAAAREVAYEYPGRAVIVVDWWRDVAHGVRESLFGSPGHAGEDETSVMMYLTPDAVDVSAARDHDAGVQLRVSAFSTVIDEILYPDAVLGRSTGASPEKGRALLEAVSREISEEVSKVLDLLSSRTGPRTVRTPP